jgi:hypothetical protein
LIFSRFYSTISALSGNKLPVLEIFNVLKDVWSIIAIFGTRLFLSKKIGLLQKYFRLKNPTAHELQGLLHTFVFFQIVKIEKVSS